jgi:small subunit ribosomal protein S16
MAVKIRLKRMGRRNRPSYRIIVADSKSPRDGRFIDALGHYDPITNPATIDVDEDLARKWLEEGAEPSETVRSIFSRLGFYKKWHDEEVIARKKQAALEEQGGKTGDTGTAQE